MKYIRRKDDVIFSIDAEIEDIDIKEYKQVGDSIEELCDEFVYKNGCGNKKDIPMLSKNDFNSLKEWYLGNGYKVNTIYGAIWTNKGLIYVAKMNEKGELDLI